MSAQTSGYDEMTNPWSSGTYNNVKCQKGYVNVDNQCVCPTTGLMTPPYKTDRCEDDRISASMPCRQPGYIAMTPTARDLVERGRPNFASNGRPLLTGTDGDTLEKPYL